MVVASLIPSYPTQSEDYIFFMGVNSSLQNFTHIPMFALWAILIRSERFNEPNMLVLSRKWVFVLGSFYGILLELIQIFVPGRYASYEDVLFDIIGIGIGCIK